MSSAEDQLCLVFIPPLITLLLRAEQLKNSPLAQSEVERIRDSAVCIRMRQEMAESMAESRGYPDISPEHCWAEWQVVRAQLQQT